MLAIAQAISRVFARLGEKKNRARARIKFLVAKMGIDAFREEVLKERSILPHDPRWTEYLQHIHDTDERPLKPAVPLNGAAKPEGFDKWWKTNVYQQRQPGYKAIKVTLPLGDLSAWQARKLADKLWHLRVMADDDGVMNRSVADTTRQVLVISQFTLYGDTSGGRRPSWISAARPEQAEPLVDAVAARLGELGATVATGRFGADMAVELVNDGPVTVLIEL